MYEQHTAMAEEPGDCTGLARACGNHGNCYENTWNYGQACEMYEQHQAMAEELGDRAGVACACGNLGNCS
jgi:hypothetical protein